MAFTATWHRTVVLCRTCYPSRLFLGSSKRQRKEEDAEDDGRRQRTVSLSIQLIYNQYISVAAAPLRLRIMARYFNNLLTIKIHLLRNRRANGARCSLTTILIGIMKLLRLWVLVGQNKSDGTGPRSLNINIIVHLKHCLVGFYKVVKAWQILFVC